MRDWINTRLKELGKTKAGLARHLGVDYPRVHELTKGKRELKTREIPQFAAYLNLSTDMVVKLFAEPDADIDLKNFNENYHVLDTNTGQTVPGGTRIVTVKSYVEAGHFSDSPEWPQDDWYTVHVPNDPEFQHVNLYGAETKGPSMNKRYIEGAIVVFTSLIETHEDIIPGRRYIIERRDGAEHESTVKALQQEKDGSLWLVPESTDPRYQQALEVKENGEQEFRIVGRVVWSCQKET